MQQAAARVVSQNRHQRLSYLAPGWKRQQRCQHEQELFPEISQWRGRLDQHQRRGSQAPPPQGIDEPPDGFLGVMVQRVAIHGVGAASLLNQG